MAWVKISKKNGASLLPKIGKKCARNAISYLAQTPVIYLKIQVAEDHEPFALRVFEIELNSVE